MARDKPINDPELVTGLYTLMSLRGLNPKALALRSGIAQSTLSSILNGKSDPGLGGTIRPLADALGVTRSELLRYGESAVGTDRSQKASRARAEERERIEREHDLEAVVRILAAASEEERQAVFTRLASG